MKIKIKIDTTLILFYKINLPVDIPVFDKKVRVTYSDFNILLRVPPE